MNCAHCDRPVTQPATVRPRLYCSRKCRKSAEYEARRVKRAGARHLGNLFLPEPADVPRERVSPPTFDPPLHLEEKPAKRSKRPDPRSTDALPDELDQDPIDVDNDRKYAEALRSSAAEATFRRKVEPTDDERFWQPIDTLPRPQEE